jgi:pimeloyl-ACP methyl ester carboxylesterase
MNETVKEILQIVVFLAIVGGLIWILVINPLSNTRDSMGRLDDQEIHIDTLPPNDATAFTEAGFTEIDTLRVEPDGVTSLAVLYFRPIMGDDQPPKGSAIVLHSEESDRSNQMQLVRVLIDSGYVVCLFDQRASGLSTGRYHGAGQYEAVDLAELISWLDVRSMLSKPLTVIGFDLGADAAHLASLEEGRIDRVVAISPYLTGTHLLDAKKEAGGYMWFPFYHTVMWWWYEIRSGYAADYIELEQMQGVVKPTLVLASEDDLALEDYIRLGELSNPEILTMTPLPSTDKQMHELILDFLAQ